MQCLQRAGATEFLGLVAAVRSEADVTTVMSMATMTSADPPFLSCVIPVYNEAANIEPLCRRIERTCRESDIAKYEVIIVENGSWDESETIIRRLHSENPRVKMLQLSRNFGYQGGISAGLAYARGEWVAVLDGDQQDPPELIPAMLDRAKEGFEIVYGVRARRSEGMTRKLAYAAFYRFWKATARIKVPLDAGDFCVMHRRVVACITSIPERQRFVRGLRAWCGFRQTGIEYERGPRSGSESKFDLLGMINLSLDGLLSYSVVPLRLMTLSGFLVAFLAFITGMLHVSLRVIAWIGFPPMFGLLPPGLTEINLLVTFLLGFTILCVGIVGEYVGRIYEEVKQRPIFIVRTKLFSDDDNKLD